ncbi:hypothetical protein K227x_61790 [Rubripirellula lacrimiformis]|uniref:Alpha/beta hydrolase family protein n=1 Tax=Rubripirellula lacrimiformis TaxID=1930273 RepID=A0A517NKU9_9BACT|nr:hypothetical protein [Rubripirellula lacrimiformis]QDT07751.1 hypothetical protein K227x_61790 [Rubripirellula lacrimiformis]
MNRSCAAQIPHRLVSVCIAITFAVASSVGSNHPLSAQQQTVDDSAAQSTADSQSNRSQQVRTWLVDGVERQAIVSLPADSQTPPTALVFVFHGHGGTMNRALTMFAMDRHWPESIVVSPQGLRTPGLLTDSDGKKPDWQTSPGQQNDRDLKFFDAMLASLKQEHNIDQQQIFATGHSNGAAFCYLLWALRGDTLTATAPSAGAITLKLRRLLKPKPAMLLAGENDQLVKFAWQQRSIEFVRRLNHCDDQPTTAGNLHTYPSKLQMPLQAYIHPGGHRFATEAAPAIAKFFQSQSKPDTP